MELKYWVDVADIGTRIFAVTLIRFTKPLAYGKLWVVRYTGMMILPITERN